MNDQALHPLQEALLAGEPHPSQVEALRLFGQFAGTWDLDVTWHENGRLTRSARGEWHFGWILDGRALQDVWIVPARDVVAAGAATYEYGTSIRFYDSRIGAWRSTWIGPVQGSVRTFIALPRGDEIVLQGQQLDGRDIEWIFSDISEQSFNWRFQRRTEPDERWEILQAFRCRRRS